MKLVRLCLFGLLICIMAPAGTLAAEEKPGAEAKSTGSDQGKAKEGKDQEKKNKEGDGAARKDDYGLFNVRDNLVPIPTIIAPVLCNDRLIAHLYVYIAAITADGSGAEEVKKRLPYVQDALVREVNDHMLVVPNPEADPDTKSMIARLKTVINAAVGKPLVTEIQVGRIDTSPY
ncbi:MAG TPA: hypothetical protein VEH07_11505 [Alphaproteobacteria bacterium]|nr:hypothetical protein [Alphaproteobacteria bacterium]